MQIYKDRMNVLIYSQTKTKQSDLSLLDESNCLARQRVHVCQILNSQDIPQGTIYIPLYRQCPIAFATNKQY